MDKTPPWEEQPNLKEMIGDLNAMFHSSYEKSWSELNDMMPLDKAYYYKLLAEGKNETDKWIEDKMWYVVETDGMFKLELR